VVGAVHVLENHLFVFRRVWKTNVAASVLQPLMYLLGLGIGVGVLVEQSGGEQLIGGVTYAAFIGPGLLAATAMNVAGMESMWPVHARFKWMATYHAMAASPLRPVDLVVGHLLWITTRVAIASVSVGVILAVVPATRSSGLPIAVVAAVLCGLAFAMPITAFAASRERENAFAAFQRFVLVPLFLFAGVFYPISQLPLWLQRIARLTPLWHGVELCRGATLHTLTLTSAVVHTLYLLMWIAAGTAASVHFYRTQLER
jgi:lipooligosaccharide transport system permease protein